MREQTKDYDETRPTMQSAAMDVERETRSTMNRKDELFQLAKGIAAQVGELTKRHERCLLRQMVEMLLDN